MEKIGFLGGSFDPIHLGHINLAIQMQEIYQLDRILFCPTNCSPHKLKNPPQESIKSRTDMLNLAIEDIANFEICSLESEEKKIFYTYDTIKTLKNMWPDSHLYLILGEDILDSFSQWKKMGQLLSLATPLIGVRESRKDLKQKKLLEVLKKGLTQIQVMEISSSYIRKRLEKKLYCSHLLPYKVLMYIINHQLYNS